MTGLELQTRLAQSADILTGLSLYRAEQARSLSVLIIAQQEHSSEGTFWHHEAARWDAMHIQAQRIAAHMRPKILVSPLG